MTAGFRIVKLIYILSLGFVPQHKFKYGRTYKEGTEEAILDFKNTNIAQRMDHQELKDIVSQEQKLVISPDYPKPDPSHPGVNVRQAFSYNYGTFGKLYFSLLFSKMLEI